MSMFTKPLSQFTVKLQQEGPYSRLYITHESAKGRVKKRIGKITSQDGDALIFRLRDELTKHFNGSPVSISEVGDFVNRYVTLKVKGTTSLFEYFDEFIREIEERTNKRTRKKIGTPTITSYKKAREYFEKYLTCKNLTMHPSTMNRKVLDDFYHYLHGKHNYRVKLHRRLKAYISYLEIYQGIAIDRSYKLSTFTEEYDNLDPEQDDVALAKEEVQKLIELRIKLMKGEVDFHRNINTTTIPDRIFNAQHQKKVGNLIRCLDCFLFMVSTGQYHADIKKSKIELNWHNLTPHLSYRRSKNNNKCKGILLINTEYFIGKEIIEQYKIRSGSNFPLALSNTHFNIHLKEIARLAGVNPKLNNKMARKTFASILYFDRGMSITLIQQMLGHKDVRNTENYLRISDRDLTEDIRRSW